MPSSERSYIRIGIGHPDHRAVGSAALDAVYPDARNPFAFPELLQNELLAAWTVREVWIAGGPDPNHYVDVTATFPRKLAALRAHESQTGHMEDLAERLRTRLALTARRAGFPRAAWPRAFGCWTPPEPAARAGTASGTAGVFADADRYRA